jgi:hypothetical protein
VDSSSQRARSRSIRTSVGYGALDKGELSGGESAARVAYVPTDHVAHSRPRHGRHETEAPEPGHRALTARAFRVSPVPANLIHTLAVVRSKLTHGFV